MTRFRSAIGLAILAALTAAPLAHGATFNVNSTTDAGDPAQGDGQCDANLVSPGLQCTLRAAIEQSGDPSSPGQDLIRVPAGTYTLNSPSELVVTSPVIVDGAAAASTTVRQALNGRVLQVTSAGSLDLRDVTVSGGAIANHGGGIFNGGTLVVRRSTVRGNQAIGSRGGGIFSNTSSSLTVEDSVIGGTAPGQGNQAGEFGGGLYAEDGLTLRRSRVLGNGFDGSAPNSEGAGLTSFGPTLISGSTIAGNGDSDTDSAGGIHLGFTPTATVSDTTISGNRAGIVGSAVLVRQTAATLRNVTVAGNTSTVSSSLNSAIDVLDATLVAQHTTIAGNSSPQGQALLVNTGSTPASSATMRASILDGGSIPACGSTGPGSETLGSTGFNVVVGAGCGFSAAGDTVADPRLGALAGNGGPTETMALATSSPALNRVASGCPGPATDQRGVPRPQGGRCDSGAYELARCGGAIVNRVGTAGADSLIGTSGPDAFLLLAGADKAAGGGGKDVACGGAGKDRLRGGAGGDRLLGQAGADRLLGQAGKDALFGAAGADRLFGGAARDRLIGGKGRDRLRGGGGRDLLRGGPGRDRQVQ